MPLYQRPRWLLEFFAWNNLAFLAVDIFMAHSVNRFAHWAEWIPVGFSVLASVALLYGLTLRGFESPVSRAIGGTVGALAVGLGLLGLLYHLHGTFFVERTLKSLVYSAPFAAPLSYSGIGFLLLLNRSRFESERQWASWVVFLALGGFVGNFALALADHAQNGFFEATEWIPVASAAFAIGALTTIFFGYRSSAYLRICLAVMVGQIGVGILGAGLHLLANLQGPAARVADQLVHGAPIFAPLLFADLGILAILGIWRIGASVGDA